MKLNTILIILLAIILCAFGFCGWQIDQERKATIAELTARSVKAETSLQEVQGLKTKLEADLNDLQNKYSALAAENEALQGSVEDAQKEIKRRKSAIYRLTKSLETKDGELATLRNQIEGLINARTQLENDIASLQQENTQLKEENAKLAADLATTQEERAALARLNETMQADIANLTLKNFKASGFTVEVEKKNGKPTTWKAFAKRVRVGFDLVDVPEKYQGLRKVYLVITDDTGVPLKKTSPVSAKISVNGQEQDIIAVSEQNVDIQESQRLSFNHELEEKLKAGFYRASVYTDLGLLGASSFRMR